MPENTPFIWSADRVPKPITVAICLHSAAQTALGIPHSGFSNTQFGLLWSLEVQERVLAQVVDSAPIAEVYDERAFHYFFEIERRRSERSNHSFVLMLIKTAQQPDDRLFGSISSCLRETDFVGWFEKGRVVGAVLTHFADVSESFVLNRVRQRVEAALAAYVSNDVAADAVIRIYELPADAQRLSTENWR